MLYTYEARLWNDEGVWYADCPTFAGLFADGKTVKEACENAAGFLQLMIAEAIDEGTPLPKAVFSEHPGLVLCVEVSKEFVKTSKCMTFAEAAGELGISHGRVSQLASNGQLEVVEHGGRRLVTIASVNERKANPPAPHRSRKG